jgi:hypothetical protein
MIENEECGGGREEAQAADCKHVIDVVGYCRAR